MKEIKKISESLEANMEKYPKEELIALSEKLFKTRREIVAGALASAEEELSILEAKMLVEKFLSRRVE